MKNKYFFSIILLILNLSGFSQSFLDGILVLNEGNFGSNAASVSFINGSNQVTNNIFGSANNNASLGDVGQSMAIHDDKAYIVLNGSNTIKVVNYETFELIATINIGVTFPRHMAFHNNKAYVTCWGDGYDPSDDYLAVINLTTNLVESTIPMAEGVETIEVVNSKLYVAHTGGYGYGTTVSVIDIPSYTISSITVGDLPNSMIVNGNYLYVLCNGMPSWSGQPETPGRIVKIDLSNNSIVQNLPFAGITHPRHLIADATNLYYTVGDYIYKMPFTDVVLPANHFIDTPVVADEYSGIYGLNLIDNKIYVADANGYAAQGYAHVYNNAGVLLNTYTLGNIPNHFYKSKESSLGNDDNTLGTFTVYPNPAVSTVFITTDKNTEVTLYDMTGKMVKKESYTLSGIDVSNLQKGIYLMEINSDNQKQVVKLAVK
ncbi:T9SS type A sorting domain-containing protein [Flavobacterium amniphilum]|uniref:T9SS type A sorting domain-containing protein n=1 Tax=Flavobacterium amniphilum TaxID=1834035 RepID=UPI002029F2C4|nr:T9SS type A sorting domain-containing protein [Flavobacterium amniphilum]MCL9807232.1 T9SS type A sorting domain-containing protein [Flavobacterium amniphilum]